MVGLPCLVSHCTKIARSWVDVVSFHMRLFIIFMIFTSVCNILDIPSYTVTFVRVELPGPLHVLITKTGYAARMLYCCALFAETEVTRQYK
jgi:hypothetical protein